MVLPVVVPEDPQLADRRGDPVRRRLVVAEAHAEEHQQARADRADHRSPTRTSARETRWSRARTAVSPTRPGVGARRSCAGGVRDLTYAAHRRRHVGRPVERGADDDHVRPTMPDGLCGLGTAAAVDLDLEGPVRVQPGARGRQLGCGDVGHERLAAEPGLDGHDHDDVEQVAVRLEAPSGVPGLSDRPAERPACRMRSSVGLVWPLDLDVERDRVAAGVEVLVDVAARLADHQVGIERQARDRGGGP